MKRYIQSNSHTKNLISKAKQLNGERIVRKFKQKYPTAFKRLGE